MSPLLGLMIESLVSVLLLLTIGYCHMLNKRLKMLRADEQSLKATIAELITATEIAERAIAGLKVTVHECNDNLTDQLTQATDICARLDTYIDVGESVLRRLSQIAVAAKAQPDERPARPAVISLLAAASAFSQRDRTNGLAA